MYGKKLRFANFALDTLICLVYLATFVMVFDDHRITENIFLIAFLFYFFYYLLFEFFKGQTPAKMITKSVVISELEYANFTFRQIFIRTLIRSLLPLDLFSFLFNKRGLHDRFSKTVLIRI